MEEDGEQDGGGGVGDVVQQALGHLGHSRPLRLLQQLLLGLHEGLLGALPTLAALTASAASPSRRARW